MVIAPALVFMSVAPVVLGLVFALAIFIGFREWVKFNRIEKLNKQFYGREYIKTDTEDV